MRALITGINGQDGSYLAESLLEDGNEVHGTIRRASLPNLDRIAHIRDQITLHWGDLSDASSLFAAVRATEPDEVYNLGAQSDVRVSFDIPEYVGDVTGLGATRLLEAVRQVRPDARYYQAGSSEMFGMNPDVPTSETSAFWPGSPYAAAKVYAHNITRHYREAYGMFACNGILFNHESERRGVEFVTRKITRGVAAIASGREDHIQLGTLETFRDWGHARDYVRAMRLMLAAEQPDDYVIATGETHSVREFAELAFGRAGLDADEFIKSDVPKLLRPVDPPVLLGDPSKAARLLGWKPEITFEQLVNLMVDYDLNEDQR
jgi:GDPmannose 4,6-dehydratase